MRYDMVRPVYPIPSTHKYIYNYHVFWVSPYYRYHPCSVYFRSRTLENSETAWICVGGEVRWVSHPALLYRQPSSSSGEMWLKGHFSRQAGCGVCANMNE